MKILTFCPYYKPHSGGLENFAEELNSHLIVNSRVDSITVAAYNIPKSPSIENCGGVNIVRLPAFEIVQNFPFPKFWSKEYRQIMARLHAEKFNIVISHTRFFVSSLLAMSFAKHQHLSWIHIEHGSDFVQSVGGLVKPFAYL